MPRLNTHPGADGALHALVGAIYDAALDPARWAGVLAAIADATGAATAALVVQHGAGGTPPSHDVLAVTGYSEDVIAQYGKHFAGRDPRQRDLALSTPGTVLADGHTLDFEAYRRTEVFDGFFRPLQLGHGLGVALFTEENRVGALSLMRDAHGGAFASKAIELVGCLVPHVRRALQVHGQLRRADALGGAAAAALDHLPTAAMLVERDGSIVAANPAADRLLSRPNCPLRAVAGRLTTPGTGAAALRRLLNAALAASLPGGPPPPPVLRLAAPGEPGPLSLLAAPARRGDMLGWPACPLVLVFAAPSGAAFAPDLAILAATFGLSPAEAAIAAGLARGQDVGAIAEGRGVSVGTVRIQVKAVLAKTGTHSQAQLVARLAGSLAALRRES